ncbi:uncharacterized protein [Choristoneura fumiferana]|uniref:uncharacterized protein n=1 Tax=Choristoneura fumiferana TaxID=7141 RepID=UPI003D155F66
MKNLSVLLIVAVSFILHEANCGVIDSVYGKVSNTTQAVKDDIHSWWSHGVDFVAGSDDHEHEGRTNEEKDTGMISGIYNRFKGGVSYGYMKVHNVVLGEDSDPNKGIIRTLFERALNRLTRVKTYIFGDTDVNKKESQEKDDSVKEQVLKVLFGNETALFKDENEKKALESLRNKLTKAGDDTLYLGESEKEIIKKAFESVFNKTNELKSDASKSAGDIKTNVQDNIEKTQEFIQDASEKLNHGAQKVREDVKKSVNNIENEVQGQ